VQGARLRDNEGGTGVDDARRVARLTAPEIAIVVRALDALADGELGLAIELLSQLLDEHHAA
jgi:hypothetical protein